MTSANRVAPLVWIRRKAKKRNAVDDIIDELISMRRKAKKEGGETQTVREEAAVT
jgi:hypothetical protein